ncbi:MAG: TraB/GumN family protein [Robiginitomaculum sp.]|nr:TraB/GumN family protein [Robiginitomaculum sp.]
MHKYLKFTAILGLALIMAGCSPNDTDKATGNKAAEESVSTEVQKQASAGPAMWLVSDEDTKVYLFGTVHILKPETQWQTDAFNAAFAASDAVYLEADLSDEVQASMAALLPPLAFYSDGRTLMGVLDEADEKEVREAAEILGLPPETLNMMKPWFAGIALSQIHMVKTGYQADSGVEKVIADKAKASKKPMRYFETAEQQLHFLAGLPEDSQIEFLVAGAEAIEDQPEMLDELVADWVQGDVKGIADLIADEDVMGDGTVYDVLLVKRNRTWTKTIDQLLEDEAGTFMIAVGAAHLAGPDSIIVMLQDAGETVTRQ